MQTVKKQDLNPLVSFAEHAYATEKQVLPGFWCSVA